MNFERIVTMNETKFRDYIKKVKWQFAKTYEKTFPHEYTIREWRLDLEDEFVDVVNFIRANGYPEKFFHKTHIYYYLDGDKYWTMGDPIETTVVLNRAKYKNIGEPNDIIVVE